MSSWQNPPRLFCQKTNILCCTVFWEQVHAIEQFKKADNIDLIILDSVMPKMNGREAYNEIHKIKPDIKVIFTSGYTRDVFLDKGIEDKEFNFLQKPISLPILLQKVREVLDDRQD